jgi:hypothetical protein
VSPDELEFLISQHLDGDLSPADEARLQAALAADASARALLAEHAKVHEVLVASRDVPELASVDLASLRANINAAIDDASTQTIKLHEHPAWGGRVLRYGSIAAAAMVAIAIGVGAFVNRGGTTTPPSPVANNQPDNTKPLLVAGNVPTGPDGRESLGGAPRIDINVGPLGAGGISVAQVFGPESQTPRAPTVASVTLGQPVGIPESALLNLIVAERNPKRVIVAPGKR